MGADEPSYSTKSGESFSGIGFLASDPASLRMCFSFLFLALALLKDHFDLFGAS